MTQNDLDNAAAEYVEDWQKVANATAEKYGRVRDSNWWSFQRADATRQLSAGLSWLTYLLWAWRIKKAVDWIIEQLKQREAEAIAASEQR